VEGLNGLDREAFVERVGFAFEDSPWVAAAAWEARPFGDVNSLHAAMVRVVEEAPAERKLALIRAHPELGARAAAARSLGPASAGEQASAGLDRLAPEHHARLEAGTKAYRDTFGFPFVVCVREHTVESILEGVESRLANEPETEIRTALAEIAKIASLRLRDALGENGAGKLPRVDYEISYGKSGVAVYRHYATPLTGLPRVPESAFEGRANALFANEVSVEVFGDNFLPAYTHGDNSSVVATDSMKNFILRQAQAYDGATLEGYLDQLGQGLLEKYEQMHGLRVHGRELPFTLAPVPRGGGFGDSEVVHQRRHDDRSVAELWYERTDDGWRVARHRCGREGLQLLKTKGSAFVRFVRDEYTTLPERSDRPLFIELDLGWTYADVRDALGSDHSRYVAGEQVRDVVGALFDQFVSESIQQLVHEMGRRLLERYPQLASVSFSARNMTRDPSAVTDDPDDDRKVFSDPFPAFGTIELTLTRRG
jgi:urate oxidase/2-oxo-4-hydroxy-4-carboxy-5-ureidoimidazoline decarboxylase